MNTIARLQAGLACLVFAFVNSPFAVLAKGLEGTGNLTVSRGTTILDAAALSSVSALTVPRRATAVIDFSNAPNAVLTGDLENKGRVFAVASNPAVTVAGLTASNIFNRHGAVVSSVV